MARIFTLMLLLLGAVAAPAHADRYAAPDGSGTACTTAAPCALGEALSVPDVVWAKPGDYGPFDTVMFATDLRGEDRTRPPVISLDGVSLGAASLRDVHVERSGGTGAAVDRPTSGPIRLERVTVINHAEGAGVKSDTVNAFDTYVLADLGPAVTIEGDPVAGELRNVTAYANGAGLGVNKTTFSTDLSVTVVNSILRGDFDLGAQNTKVAVSYTNYATTATAFASIDEGAGNQEEDPLLADPLGGDPRPLAGSPTIDAGTAEGAGAEAWLAFPRALGPAPDIGAAEYAPPPLVTTLDAAGVSDTAATVRADADGRGLPGQVTFEYGPTAAYGSTTAAQPIAALVTVTLAGLAPGTSYHYRAVATTRAGRSLGADRTFTTTAPDASAPELSALALTRKRFRVGSAITPLIAAAKAGTKLRYSLSEAATVRVKVQRAVRGRRKGGKCRPRASSGKRCIKWRTRATLTRTATAGANRVAFSGRFGQSKRLKPGRHRFSLVATDAAGNASKPQRIRFRVTRR